MILGIGCDVVEIKRIKDALQKHKDKFLLKNFTTLEIENAPVLDNIRVAYFAKRFAGKEAFAKALGSGIGEKVEFRDIEILNEESGKPYLTCNKHAGFKFHITLSDEMHYAIAFVVIEKI